MSSSKDPMDMAGLEPASISKAIEEKSKAKIRPPSELDLKKEERLSKKEERMQAKLNAAAAPPPPPPVFDPSYLLDMIGAYRERFPHLKSRNKVSAKSTVEELEDEVHYIEMQLGSSKDGSLGCLVLHGSMVGLEFFTRDVYNPLGLNLTGLGQVTKDNMSEFQPIIDELMIKYGAGMYMSPETRLVLAVGAMVVTVHSANSGDPRVAEAIKKMNNVVQRPKGSGDL